MFHWATWPYLIACLSGLQSINGLSTWGATIIQSLGFSSINANLLNAPGPIAGAIFGVILSSFVDRYKRFGYAIVFAGVWTLAGLVALYVSPPSSNLGPRLSRYEQSLIPFFFDIEFTGGLEVVLVILRGLYYHAGISVGSSNMGYRGEDVINVSPQRMATNQCYLAVSQLQDPSETRDCLRSI